MNRQSQTTSLALRWCLPFALCVPASVGMAATPFTFASYPLFLAPPVLPNVLVLFDNSESMDATMAGKVISGDDLLTRGNIARTSLRGILDTYRTSFNWGLGSFEISGGPTLYKTHAYYVGNATTMVYTTDCVGGISASNGGLRCIVNPEPANGFGFITYSQSGDDADINDVLYSGSTANQMYGIGTTGVSYQVRGNRVGGIGWADTDFSGCPFGCGAIPFVPTDAGWLPQAATMPRQIWIKRGWGYGNDITGKGKINEPVQADSVAHFNALKALLANETNTGSGEIKNAAFYTPLTGTVKTSRDYFTGNITGSSNKSPVSETCQRNFVVLATDGNPTGKTDGNQYNPSEWVNTEGPPGVWTYGQAQLDVFAQISALRTATLSGSNLTNAALSGRAYDFQTYVIGMGDTLTNASSIAALNRMAELGGGYPTAFLTSSGTALETAFQSIVGDIQSKTSAASSVALNAGSWTTGSALYQAKFSSADWSGNLVAFAVAASGTLSATPAWEAASQVKNQNWNTGRTILGYKPSASSGARGIPFRWPVIASAPTATELDAVDIASLNKNATNVTDGYGEWRLKFLRGDSTKEARNCSGACLPQFRNRNATPLGDIVNSSPFYVSAPAAGYYDDMESVPYSGFRATYRNRTPVIYVGANDGMLHGINALTGDELLAYVPSALTSSLSQLTSTTYSHRYFADGSPAVRDVFYGGAWHTLLASGMRSGAKGIFALDVTNPAGFSEANAANIVRWEYQHADLGYVVHTPVLAKTNNGRWSVIVSNGYNAGAANFKSMLFIIDAETGVLVKKIDTGAGTAASPNGLSGPSTVDTNGDGVVDYVYAGDLNGNMWKFDISSTATASWGVGNGGLALFTTPSSQPITTRPNFTLSPRTGYMVVFGSGSYMSTTDATNTAVQTLYGIWDNGAAGTLTVANLALQSIVTTGTGGNGTQYRLSTHAVGKASDNIIAGDETISSANYYLNKRGWYINLPDSGERVNGEARVRGGRVIFTTLIPDTSSPCAFGGSGWVMEFDVQTGNRYDSGTFNTNTDNTVTSADNIVFGGYGPGGNVASGQKIGAIAASPSIMEVLPTGTGGSGAPSTLCEEMKYHNKSDGGIEQVREKCGRGGSGRVMWREVQ